MGPIPFVLVLLSIFTGQDWPCSPQILFFGPVPKTPSMLKSIIVNHFQFPTFAISQKHPLFQVTMSSSVETVPESQTFSTPSSLSCQTSTRTSGRNKGRLCFTKEQVNPHIDVVMVYVSSMFNGKIMAQR